MDRKVEKEHLTVELADEYHKKSMQLGEYGYDLGANRKLKEEMCNRFGITELEALNILSGFHIKDYVLKYERLRSGIVAVKTNKIINEEQQENLAINKTNDWIFDRLEELENELSRRNSDE